MSNNINNFLRCVNLRKRLVLGFAIIPIISICIMFILFYRTGISVISKKVNNYSEEFLAIVEKNISLNVSKFEQQLDEILLSSIINEYLMDNKLKDSVQKGEFKRKVDEYVYSKIHLLSNSGEIEVISADLNILYTQGFKYFHKEDIIKYSEMAKRKPGKTIWFHTNIDGDGTIGIARAIQNRKSRKVDGYIFVALKEEALGNTFLKANLGEDNTVVVLNEKNEFIFGQKNLEYKYCIEASKKKVVIDNITYYINSKRVNNLDWKVVNLISVDYMIKEFNELAIKLVGYTIVFFTIIAVFAHYIHKSVYKPIMNLVTSMNAVSEGDFDAKVKAGGHDEITILSSNFNELVEKVKNLLIEVKNAQKLKREAEIKMLQAQINPHFLFNTLNTFKWIADMNEDIPVSKGLTSLAKLLRNTIIDKNEFITVREEIENVKNYIVIQKLRYGDVFDVKYNIDEKIMEHKTIKFLLQPIVENSILHAFHEEGKNQFININIRICKDQLIINISDTGKGFKQDNLIYDRCNNLSGIGIKNIDERIKLTFGTNYGVNVKSIINKGTEVKINLPII